MNPSVNRRCRTCRGHVERLCAAYCNACRPVAGAAPYARVAAKAREVAEHGDSPQVLADALGVTVKALHRRFRRHGDDELALWVQGALNAGNRSGLALWDPAAA